MQALGAATHGPDFGVHYSVVDGPLSVVRVPWRLPCVCMSKCLNAWIYLVFVLV